MTPDPLIPERALFSSASAAYIARTDGRVLLVHQARAGSWGLPGGKAEQHETPRATCEREGREELGVPVTAGRLLTFNWLAPGAAGDGAEFAHACHFLTFQATIDPADLDRITVPAGELLDWRWWEVEAAVRPGVMEPFIAANLRVATQVYRDERPTAYLEV